MIPISINRNNIIQWVCFGLLEAWRITRALFVRAGSREAEVTRYVEQFATPGDPDSVLEAMDRYAQDNRFLMNVGTEKGRILLRELRESGGLYVLELGAYCGYSAVLMGKELKKQGGRLVSIESSENNARFARRVIEHAGLGSVVEVKVGRAADMIPLLRGPFDLVFIDHYKDDYLTDLRRIEIARLLRPGSRIVADNVGIFSGTLDGYLHYVRNAGHMLSEYHPAPMEYRSDIDDGVEVSIWQRPRMAS